MRIAIDVRGGQEGFKEHFGRGIGRYVTEVAPRLLALLPGNEISFIFDARYPAGSLGGIESVTRHFTKSPVPLPGRQEILRGHLGLRPLLRKSGADVVLHFCHEDALWGGPRSAAFVYDLIPLRFPMQYRVDANAKNRLRARLFRAIARGLDLIFTISENSARDIEELWGIPSERIINVSAAIDATIFHRKGHEECGRIRARYLLPEKYLLYVGGIDPRKNVPVMIRALRAALTRVPELRLVMVGKLEGQEGYQELESSIAEFCIAERFSMIGPAPDSDLPAIYSGAEALVFPSLYEGFGLPILEALACGIPVIAGRLSAIPEAAGELAVYCDMRDAQALAEAMAAVWGDRPLRDKFACEGPLWAARFTWDAVASRVAEGLTSLRASR